MEQKRRNRGGETNILKNRGQAVTWGGCLKNGGGTGTPLRTMVLQELINFITHRLGYNGN